MFWEIWSLFQCPLYCENYNFGNMILVTNFQLTLLPLFLVWPSVVNFSREDGQIIIKHKYYCSHLSSSSQHINKRQGRLTLTRGNCPHTNKVAQIKINILTKSSIEQQEGGTSLIWSLKCLSGEVIIKALVTIYLHYIVQCCPLPLLTKVSASFLLVVKIYHNLLGPRQQCFYFYPRPSLDINKWRGSSWC